MKLTPIEMLAKHNRDLCEAYSEQQSRVVNLEPWLLCRTLGKYLLYTSPRDLGMTPHLAFDGHWEMWNTLAIARQVPRGRRYLDIGGGYGYFTMLLADLAGRQGCVRCYEPNPRLAELTRLSVKANGFHTVTVVECAVVPSSAAREPFKISVNWENIGGGVVTHGAAPEQHDLMLGMEEREIDVSVVDLNDVPEDVSFVKVDCTDQELRIWRALYPLRKMEKPLQIMIQLSDGPITRKEMASTIIQDAWKEGFSLYEVDPEGDLAELNEAKVLDQTAPPPCTIWLRR